MKSLCLMLQFSMPWTHAGAVAELGWEEVDAAEHQWPGSPHGEGGTTNQSPLSNSRAIPAPLPREGSQGRQNFKYFGVILFYISGSKNWFLVWSGAFQAVRALPALSSQGGGRDKMEEGKEPVDPLLT